MSTNWELRRIISRNSWMRKKALSFRKELLDEMTNAERKFNDICYSLGLDLESQYIVYIYRGKLIDRFYIADFCDLKNNIIFEIDGKHHHTLKQMIKDTVRDFDLKRLGYKVYRISNEDVYKENVLGLLIEAYKDIY